MRTLDVGSGRHKREGAVGLDRVALPGVDVVHDLESFPWPFGDSEFDEVFATQVLEHLHAFLPAMEEIHRILKPGGRLYVAVPDYRSERAFRDPTHVRFFTEQTFDYFTPTGTTESSERNYYSSARFSIEDRSVQWLGGLSWHVDRYVHRRGLQTALHRLLRHRPATLRFTLVAVK